MFNVKDEWSQLSSSKKVFSLTVFTAFLSYGTYCGYDCIATTKKTIQEESRIVGTVISGTVTDKYKLTQKGEAFYAEKSENTNKDNCIRLFNSNSEGYYERALIPCFFTDKGNKEIELKKNQKATLELIADNSENLTLAIMPDNEPLTPIYRNYTVLKLGN